MTHKVVIRNHPTQGERNHEYRDKVITTLALTLAVPFAAALVLPMTLVVPMAMVASFVALTALEPVAHGGAQHA